MSKENKFELNYEGVGKLLKSSEMRTFIDGFAKKNYDGYVRSFVGFDRAKAFVYEERKGNKK